jgi:electron transfer flavoprotein beta subunit
MKLRTSLAIRTLPMKLLVCIKQVMESTSGIKINNSGRWITYSDDIRFAVNTYDMYAIEEAIRIKETLKDVRVDVITVGPARAEDVLRRALGMGADEAIHILDEKEGYRPPALTALWIARTAKKKDYDLILAGIMSEDEMNGQTGPMIAKILDLPCTGPAIEAQIRPVENSIMVEREIEGGGRDIFNVSLPCLLTIQSGINQPRYPALSKVLRAKKKEIEFIAADSLETLCGQPRLHTLELPLLKPQGLVLEGNARQKASDLVDILAAKSYL